MIRSVFLAVSTSCMALSSAALAGETPLYEDAPAWIEPIGLSEADLRDGHAEVLQDWQHRLEGGVVTAYLDRMVRIDNPDALDEEGTLQLTWLPDKGDLRVHALEILRGGETIDVLAQGARFEVLRRERGLEQRLLDGQLTATMAVPGLRQGDILRLSYSTTTADQALGKEMQETRWLASEPFQLQRGRAIFSWPTGSDVVWQAGPDVDMAAPVSKDGYDWLRIDYPLPKRAELPQDAPSRFTRAQVVRVGTYADWNELSRTMYPHYDAAADISEVPELMDMVADIRSRHSDPLAQMAAATRIVQDEVSYLLDGLDGGNYLPQDAADTWEKRYGDCKAKSVLLLAMLRELEIPAQVVLVATQGGDALPELMPLPANFDHMIVRAMVDGTDYWLDGTSSGTRLANVADVPPFFHALPLTESGEELAAMSQRSKQVADMAMVGTFDYSAGIDLPHLYRLDIIMTGGAASNMRSFADKATPEMRKQMARQFTQSMGSGEVTSIELSYDDESSTGTIALQGVADSEFEFDNSAVSSALGTFATGIEFSPDRARPSWRDIPVQTNGPSLITVRSEIVLPPDVTFAFDGQELLEGSAANVNMRRAARMEAGRVVVDERIEHTLGEIAPEELTGQKLAAKRLSGQSLKLKSVSGLPWRWTLPERDLQARIAPLIAAYTKAVEDREDDDFSPLLSRASFYRQVYMYDEALADYDAVLAEEPTADLHLTRAYLLFDMDRHDAMQAALGKAYELDPQNSTAFVQAEMLSRTGKHDEALELMELLPVAEEEQDSFVGNMALNLGRAGQVDSGLETLAARLADEGDNAYLLNSDCWFRGLHAVALDDALAQCTRAVERAEYPAAALDSRALVHYRMGELGAAKDDLDAALRLSPDLAAAHFMRGVIRLEEGDRAGKRDIAVAKRLSPGIEEFYALYEIGTR